MKMIIKLLIVSFIVSILLVQVPTGAQESFIYSVRAQKGVTSHTLEDYSDAEPIQIGNSNLFVKQMYVKNSESYLYIGMRVVINASLSGIALVFDVDHDLKYAEDVKIMYTDGNLSDGYFYQDSALSLQAQSYFSGNVYNVTYIDGKTYNLFEFSIPLNPNSIPTNDMFISDPSDYMLGFDFVEIMNSSLISWTRGNLNEPTIHDLNSNASSFYTMVLAGPGKYAVPDFNPVVTTSTQPATTAAVTATATYDNKLNNVTASSAASPGFEILFAVLGLVMIIGLRKLKLRRSNK